MIMHFKEDNCHFISRVLIAAFTASFLIACGDSTQPKTEPKGQDEGVAQTSIDPKVFTVQINISPLFESAQGWGPGFARAAGKGRGVVVGPGADNPNVFAQQFPAKPGEQFKVIARASSVDKSKTMGRIQINWTNQGKYISSSIKAFAVTPDERTIEGYVTVPAGATAGTLYVAPHGKEDVVRYTEMRVLGAKREAKPNSGGEAKAFSPTSSSTATSASPAEIPAVPNPFPKPPNLTPLDGSGRSLTVAESRYYFYHAAKAMQRKARERDMDFIMFVMPNDNIPRLMPAIRQLRTEGVKVLAYEPQGTWRSGVDWKWYWQKADGHWTEAAVRLTADEILRMWRTGETANRPFSKELMTAYGDGFPPNIPSVSDEH